jgi:hypothetical protein
MNNHKIGDRIYWKYSFWDTFGEIGSATIKDIEDAESEDINGERFKYQIYITAKDGNYINSIEDYNCEDENSPDIIDYKKKIETYVQEKFESLYSQIFSEPPTEEQKQLVNKILEIVATTNISQELSDKFNFYY